MTQVDLGRVRKYSTEVTPPTRSSTLRIPHGARSSVGRGSGPSQWPLQPAWKNRSQRRRPLKWLRKTEARAMSHSRPPHWLWLSSSFGGWLRLASGLWAGPADHYRQSSATELISNPEMLPLVASSTPSFWTFWRRSTNFFGPRNFPGASVTTITDYVKRSSPVPGGVRYWVKQYPPESRGWK